MAYKPRAIDLDQRDQRERGYQAARTVAQTYPGVTELSLELRFSCVDGKALLSPYRQIYSGDMRAYFGLQCPSRECEGGGFDLHDAVGRGARSRTGAFSGHIRCSGVLSSTRERGAPCPVKLSFEVKRTRHDDDSPN